MAYKAVLIDDNKNTVLSLEYSIEWENLGIELAGTAYDGRSGKELIEKTDPDIIISDINMPYLDGFTMVEESGKAEDRIIIVITGYDKFQYASRAIKLAVFDYILKPIDDEELNDSLKRAVRKLDKKHSLENQKINTVKAMMTVAITNHRDDTVGNITESEKEPVKRGLVMIGALKGEPSKALLERVETLTLLSSGNAYSIVTEERIILLVTEKRENSGWQAEIEKLKEKLTTLEELSALGISSEKEETASFYSLYLEAYEDLLKKSKKENHMQVSDLQENALRLADSIKGMEDYEALRLQLLAKRKNISRRGFIRKTAGKEVKLNSNGETAYEYFDTKLKNDTLYCLDEPENSLSPKMQIELVKLLETLSHYCGCQFIIATHSPFILALQGARIYDLDETPVDIKNWWELENTRTYYEFFKKNVKYFER